jgi:hypothetical protein
MTYMVWFTPSEGTFDIGTDWGYPNSVESHSLDVVEFIDDASPITTAVSTHFSITCSYVAVGKSESIGHDPRL